MALAETPETVNARRQRQAEQESREREAPAQPPADDASADPFAESELSEGLRRGVVKHGEARDDSHPAMRTLRNVMRGWNGRGYVQVLGILEIVCPTDRAFENARRQVLTLMNSQERTMMELLNRYAGPPQAKAKE